MTESQFNKKFTMKLNCKYDASTNGPNSISYSSSNFVDISSALNKSKTNDNSCDILFKLAARNEINRI